MPRPHAGPAAIRLRMGVHRPLLALAGAVLRTADLRPAWAPSPTQPGGPRQRPWDKHQAERATARRTHRRRCTTQRQAGYARAGVRAAPCLCMHGFGPTGWRRSASRQVAATGGHGNRRINTEANELACTMNAAGPQTGVAHDHVMRSDGQLQRLPLRAGVPYPSHQPPAARAARHLGRPAAKAGLDDA